MKITYFPQTDTLAIDLADEPSAETNEIAEGVTVDYGADGRVIGIDIEHAAARLDLSRLVVDEFPGEVQRTMSRARELIAFQKESRRK
jgi:uncharacterized protein YuzE